MRNSGMVMAIGLMLVGGTLLAQETTQSGKSKSENRTITGCLSQGGSVDKFVLTGKDGSTWDLKSDKVALADHVGHTITAKGKVSNVTMHNMKEEAKDTAAAAGMKKENAEHGDLEVSSLQMVSKTCK